MVELVSIRLLCGASYLILKDRLKAAGDLLASGLSVAGVAQLVRASSCVIIV